MYLILIEISVASIVAGVWTGVGFPTIYNVTDRKLLPIVFQTLLQMFQKFLCLYVC